MAPSSHSRRAGSLAKPAPASSSAQPDLFQQLSAPAPTPANADLDIGPELLGAINTALRLARTSGMSRDRIVDRMNELLPDQAITLRQLNAWTAQSKEFHEFPARYMPAFCAATDCDLPLRVLAQAYGRDLIDAREATAKQLGETQIEIARLRRHAGSLTRTLGQ
ncbi:MAG: hypothetical protein ACT4QA_23095 [Panacagrimonas sp.]